MTTRLHYDAWEYSSEDFVLIDIVQKLAAGYFYLYCLGVGSTITFGRRENDQTINSGSKLISRGLLHHARSFLVQDI